MTRTKTRRVVAAIIALMASAAAMATSGGTARADADDPCNPTKVALCFHTTAYWYTNPSGSGPFDSSGTFLFSQATLNTIDYQNQSNPPVFTDTQEHGTPLPAQNATYKMGAGNVYPFEAAFTGTLSVPSSGNLTLSMYADDAWYIGFGKRDTGTSQPTYVSGPQTNTPATTFKRGYPVLAGVNTAEGASLTAFTINFPVAGDYPFEIEYTEVNGDGAAIIFGDSGGTPIVRH